MPAPEPPSAQASALDPQLLRLRRQLITVSVLLVIAACYQRSLHTLPFRSIAERIGYNFELVLYYARQYWDSDTAVIMNDETEIARELGLHPQGFSQYRLRAEQAARKYGLDPHLVLAVIATESRFIFRAVSPKGAQGLMQLMPGTARDMGVTDITNPDQNLDGGCRYLKLLLGRFKGDIELTLAAYNAGPATVERYRGIPPFYETESYVRKVLLTHRKLRASTKS